MVNLGSIPRGTPGYMAPEQFRGGVVDHRSDLFNLGAILCEMLTGQRLFRGRSTSEILSAIQNDDPIEVPESDGKLDPGTARLLRRCPGEEPQRTDTIRSGPGVRPGSPFTSR